MQAEPKEVSADKATTPRYDTIVIRGATGQTIPKQVDGGEVVSWSVGHGLAAMDALEEFVSDLADGNCNQPPHLTQGAANAINLMRRRNALGWEVDEPTRQQPADWKSAVADAVATARKLFDRIEDELLSVEREDHCWNHSDLLSELFSDEWWYAAGDATEPNPDYQYLQRIVLAVQAGLRQAGLAQGKGMEASHA